MLIELNYLAILVAAISNMIIGSIWYAPPVLGNLWAEAHKFRLEDLKPTPLHYVQAFIVSFIIAWALGALLKWFDVTSLKEGLGVSFLIWLGFIATTHFSGVIWAKKPLKAYLIDVSFHLLSIIVMGIILVSWS